MKWAEVEFLWQSKWPSTLMGYRNFGNEDSQIQHFQNYGNQKYLGKEKDVYKKVVYRK